MEDGHFDPEQVRRATETAAGPLGQEMGRFPLRFAKVVFFGTRPERNGSVRVNNGTATLLHLGGRPIAITCSHVIESYRECRSLTNCVFQIGNLGIDPLERIIDESSEFDLVTIDLSGLPVEDGEQGGGIGSCIFTPSDWPPNPIAADDSVAFGGFPGEWREFISWDQIVFDSFSSGACRITAIHDTYFVCQFERQFWVQSFNLHGRSGMDLSDLGGLSGGPVFIHRELHWELVGIIYEFSSEFDLMRIRPARLIGDDGTIMSQTEVL